MQSMRLWIFTAAALSAGLGHASAQSGPLTGEAAYGDWRSDRPGVVRLIRPADLPKPGATASSSNSSRVVPRPASAMPQVPAGFRIELFAGGLSGPRQIRVAPNGDLFVAETGAGRVRVLRPGKDGSKPVVSEIFAGNLGEPFGIAFFPAGDNPEWVYIASSDRVVRFPYRSGDTRAAGKPETVVASLPDGGHSTRDVVFSNDGRKLMVSVGSASNVAQGMANPPGGLGMQVSRRVRSSARREGTVWPCRDRGGAPGSVFRRPGPGPTRWTTSPTTTSSPSLPRRCPRPTGSRGSRGRASSADRP